MLKRILSCSVFAVVLFGCSPTIDQRGYNPDMVDFSKITLGVDTKEQVEKLLGSPSSISNFKDDAWYYISRKTSTTSFFTPKVLEQKIVIVMFDASGRVSEVKEVDQKDGQEVIPIDRKTETTGYERSTMRDVFGNFGRMGSKGGKGATK